MADVYLQVVFTPSIVLFACIVQHLALVRAPRVRRALPGQENPLEKSGFVSTQSGNASAIYELHAMPVFSDGHTHI